VERKFVDTFEAERPRLFGLAYRLLGSAADAEDIVQDAFLRWSSTDQAVIVAPRAWLVKAVTNLCLTQLASARVQRERYVGTWLPEPVVTDDGALGPLETAQQRSSVSLALLVLLERLGPKERAVFVLRESFAYEHGEISEALSISEQYSRQLYRRARQRVGDCQARFNPRPEQWRSLVESFLTAARSGDLGTLERTLADEVTYLAGDGGGKARVARRPVVGRDRVARFFVKVVSHYLTTEVEIAIAEVNCQPALLGWIRGMLAGIMVFEIADGRITSLLILANPDKLTFAARQAATLSRIRSLSSQ
jgi:RNA polymerase sigma-70 factor (TIGR02957 family)